MSAFRGLNNVAVVGREIRSWAERPLKRGVRISEVRISEVPLYKSSLKGHICHSFGLCLTIMFDSLRKMK